MRSTTSPGVPAGRVRAQLVGLLADRRGAPLELGFVAPTHTTTATVKRIVAGSRPTVSHAARTWSQPSRK